VAGAAFIFMLGRLGIPTLNPLAEPSSLGRVDFLAAIIELYLFYPAQ